MANEECDDKPDSGECTPKQERQQQRRVQRKLARAIEDVAYGLRYSKQSTGAATTCGAYGAKKGDDVPGVQADLKAMLDEELGDLFKGEELGQEGAWFFQPFLQVGDGPFKLLGPDMVIDPQMRSSSAVGSGAGARHGGGNKGMESCESPNVGWRGKNESSPPILESKKARKTGPEFLRDFSDSVATICHNKAYDEQEVFAPAQKRMDVQYTRKWGWVRALVGEKAAKTDGVLSAGKKVAGQRDGRNRMNAVTTSLLPQCGREMDSLTGGLRLPLAWR